MNTDHPEPPDPAPALAISYRPSPRAMLLVALTLLVIQLLATLAVYPVLPNTLASHWNAQGQVDSFLPKWAYVLILPVISVGLYTFLALILRVAQVAEPRSGNRDADSVQRQRRLGVKLVGFLMIGQQTLFLLTQIGLLLLALLRTGGPAA